MNRKHISLHWHRRLLTLVAVIAVLLIVVFPVSAITYGEPDGNAHPFVGAMVLRIPDEGVFQICTGTLISETVFLTASHCTYFLDDLLADIPGSELLVTFDPTISESSTYYTGQWYTNPDFLTNRDAADTSDIAVIVLDESPGIEPARLPTAGLLDELKDSGVLRNTRFTAVGYGTIRVTNTTGPHGILDNMDRNRVEQGFRSLTKSWLNLSMTLPTGDGGTCYGDSGGPHFIHMNGEETNIVVSITITGDVPCVSSDKTYRTDTEAAREFLSQFVDLP